MAFDPMQGFQVGQSIGKSKRSAYGTVTDYLPELAKEREKQDSGIDKITKAALLKGIVQSPLQQAQTNLANTRSSQIGDGRDVYTVNPATGELEKSGNVPFGAKVLKKDSPSGAEASQLSNIDQMLSNISNIRTKLQQDPKLPLKAKVPFMAQDYKAYINNLKRQIALETGGKNLTANELAIVHQNIPNEEDIFSPDAMEIKLQNIENTVTGTKNRLTGGQFTQQQNGNDDEEKVFQSLRAKFGGK